MRIIKTSDRAAFLKTEKQKANIGCNECPCCGKQSEYIVSGLEKTWAEGFFKTKSMKCDCYSCLACGAQWESEPYEWQ